MKIATYNIHYGIGLDGQFDLKRILDEVRDADIIALQEVEVGWDRSGNTDQPVLIQQYFQGFETAWGPTIDVRKTVGPDQAPNGRRQFGNMILSRYPIISIRRFLFPKYGASEHLEMQKGALEAVVETPLGMVRVYSVHLCNLSDWQRKRQLEILLDHDSRAVEEGPVLSGRHADASWTSEPPLPPMPRDAIILGDMNFTPDSAAYESIVGEYSSKYGHLTRRGGFVDAWAHSNPTNADNGKDAGVTTRNHSETGRRVDYCFVSTGLSDAIASANVVTGADGSDHYPLIVTMNAATGL